MGEEKTSRKKTCPATSDNLLRLSQTGPS